MLGIGAIIGAGIFATIGTAAAGDLARPGAGPALIISFVITGIACDLLLYAMLNLPLWSLFRKCLHLFLCNAW